MAIYDYTGLSGGTLASGASTTLYAFVFTYTGSGGHLFSGDLSLVTKRQVLATGAIKIGTSAITEWQRFFTFIVSGGLKLSGIGVTSWKQLFVFDISGGIKSSGNMTVFYKKKYTASGGTKLTYVWQDPIILTRTGKGGLKCSGTVVRSKNRSWIPKGKILI